MPTIEIIVSERAVIWPLVVRLLAAKRRLDVVCSVPITTHASTDDRASASSIICLDRLHRVPLIAAVLPAHQRPPSATVLSTLTPRNSAAGAPCDTGAD